MYLSERSKKILLLLLAEEQISSYDDLARQFNVSERTIRYDLEEIDDYLIAKKLPPIIRQTKIEVSLEKSNNTFDKLRELSKDYENDIIYHLPENRKHIIFLEILLSKELVDIDLLMTKCNVSRSSIVGDIRKLRKILKSDSIEIEYTTSKGYFFSGDEQNIRKIGKKVIRLNADELNLSQQRLANDYLTTSGDIVLSVIEHFISKIEKDVNKQYSDISFNHIVCGLLIAVSRIQAGKTLTMSSSTASFSQEYQSINKHSIQLEKELNIGINNSEKKAFEQLFLESSLIKAESVIDDNWIDLNLFIIEFLDKISRSLGLPLNEEEDLFRALALHLGPAINRVRNETPLKNEVIEYIQTNYEEIFLKVKVVLDKMGNKNDLMFTADEVGFVTIHIASFIEKNELTSRNKSILLVCNYGIGTTKLLETLLSKQFDFNIKGTFSLRELNQSLIDNTGADFIISTLPIKEHYSVPVIVVSPTLSVRDNKKLRKIEDIKKENRTAQYLTERKGEMIMLKDLLIEETIELNVEADNWKESVRKGGELLIRSGKIEETYIHAMIKSVEELGPYIVIAPGIAMPHASSKEGVSEVGLSLMTLKEPVNFGHPDNDPVSIVICLAATDHNSHLSALKDLMGFLNEPGFIDLLKNGSKKEIIDEINREEK
ncbi:Transcriptional antiterminator [Marinilactibacillus piezotolerans]|uniref:Transcriptional antiterminator n=1 Tax=Marinilactibacillus piezotolerans TaxID=258723 RepID=A0A1I3ZUS7_9LACT|nr:BglG family transcription antiterminator [Marinilactibacillus piezotolerans]SFK47892.1 Transcriptional antiterminator [Marinilactibacillus piezotolerans]